jgi:hypothetical protein
MHPINPKRGTAYLAAILLTLSPLASGTGTNPESRRLAVADAMLNMMDSMGMFGRSSDTQDGSGDLAGQTWGGMSQGMGYSPWNAMEQGMGYQPWAGMTPGMARQPWGTMNQFPFRMPWPQASAASSRTARLDGEWRSSTGEHLWVRNGRFHLQSGANRSINGLIAVRGKLLSMYLPRLKRSLVYEFAQYQGRLALRDARGNLFLYRKQGGAVGTR